MRTKTLLLLLVLISSIVVNAQDEKQNNTITPSKGSFSFEVDFLPFSSDGPINLNAFRGRYFLNDKFAVNLNFNFDSKKIHHETPNSYQNNLVFDSEDGRYNVFGIGTGIEYHFLPDSRISPYAGVNFTYEMKSSNYESLNHIYGSYPDYTMAEVKTEIENAWAGTTIMGYDQYGNPIFSYESTERAYNSIKANVVLGADIYIVKHLYMGFELGLGINNIKYKEVIIKEEGNLESKYPEAKDFTFGLNFNNAIRLGVWF